MSAKLENPSPFDQGAFPTKNTNPVVGERTSTTGSTWTTAAKNGIGTAFYEPHVQPSLSNVWFTLTQGILSEVYYPTLSHPNLQTLQFIVSDRKTFTNLESSHSLHQTNLLDPDALVYQQVNTAINGRYQITKTYITNPNQHCVLVQVTFQARVGTVSDYDLFLYVNPILSNDATDDVAMIRMDSESEGKYLLVEDSHTSLAVMSTTRFVQASAGLVKHHPGVLDWIQQFQEPRADNSFEPEIGPADVHCLAQVHSAVHDTKLSFTIALGFGNSQETAIESARVSLSQPFNQVLRQYRAGWQGYVQGLSPPLMGSQRQYYAAVMTMKALEDKLHPGAVIASPSIPWGDNIPANTVQIGGYHLVWVRDLYQVASSLAAAGDVATARRALLYMANVLQRGDGSFPQNAWVDGTPYWVGLQQDQVAFPILLAYQLGEYDFYPTLVKRAADFLVHHGPRTDQERWEENPGYSPSTIAAEIAALVVAAEMARCQLDFPAAATYLATADAWFSQLDSLTVTHHGHLSNKPYYVRVSDSNQPDDGHWIDIKNGGGWHPKSEIVDAGFLELVRLGIKPPDDPIITHSLNVMDDMLLHETPYGPVWYRYNHDGYGEKVDGAPYDGTGKGRPWPVLTGERGEYEICLLASNRQTSPDRVFGPESLLTTMACFANDGLMIPEQVWDAEVLSQRGLRPASGTGAATPLTWAMAQYVRLTKSIEAGKIIEMPAVVKQRYLTGSLTSHELHVEVPANHRHLHTASTEIRGTTTPHSTITVYQERAPIATLTANGTGKFTAFLQLRSIGEQQIEVVSYDNRYSVSVVHISLTYEPRVFFNYQRPQTEQASLIEYPSNPVFRDGDFSLLGVRVLADERRLYVEIRLGHLDNPWLAPSGISKQLIDIYIDMDGVANSGQQWTKGLNARFSPTAGWEKLIRINGNWHHDACVYNSDWTAAGAVEIQPRYETNSILASVPLSAIGSLPGTGWGFMVVVAGESHGELRKIGSLAQEWSFGCPQFPQSPPQFVDLSLPAGYSLRRVLEESSHASFVQLPTNRI